ncbi:hypothetical protein FDP41_003211 [Naegleria fowleri]|uniref:Uncharacterized protein n=1 Tax=Naegleria fowleri TaxID=5763 RepID=A0A6A5BY62_NAEFO|nr:uncharacterized protein FDP41_003211 [Naegleria fowleri]KAF0977889.1 hypothetical protein FDP41_003211 [Naegleria fowleri]
MIRSSSSSSCSHSYLKNGKAHHHLAIISLLLIITTNLLLTYVNAQALITLTTNQATNGTVQGNAIQYYYITNIPDLASPNSSLSFIVTPISGDADLYISTSRLPDINDPTSYLWSSTVQSGTDTVTINKQSAGYKVGGPYYIAVHGYQKPALFSILVLNSDLPTFISESLPQNVFVEPNQFLYFTYVASSAGYFSISVNALFGDPNLYVSTTNTKPGPNNAQWKKEAIGDDYIFINAPSPTTYYIAVTGRGNERTQFNLQISSISTQGLVADGLRVYDKIPSSGKTYFKFFVATYVDTIQFTCNKLSFFGDPDIYISKTNEYPSKTSFDWKEEGSGTSTITVSDSSQLLSGWFYIGIEDDSFFDVEYFLLITTTYSNARLSNGIPITKGLIANKVDYYMFYVEANTQGGKTELDVIVTPRSGEELVVYGSRTFRNPSETSHDLVGALVGGSIVLHKDDSPAGPYYISVTSLSNTNYTITATTKNSYTELLDAVEYSSTVGSKKQKVFVFPIANNDVAVGISLTSMSGDADMYVSISEDVSKSNYDWHSMSTSRSEFIHIPANAAQRHSSKFTGRLFIAIYGYTSATFSIVAYSQGNTIELESGVPVSGLLDNSGDTQYYKYYQSNRGSLTFNLQPGYDSHDPDIYVSRTNPKPGPQDYDYHGITLGDDVITITNAQPGNYFIGVFTFYPNTSYTLVVSSNYMNLGSYGVPLLDTVPKGQFRYYYTSVAPGDYGVVGGVTLIEGNTRLYVSNSTIHPSDSSYTYIDTKYPGNFILMTPESANAGEWVYGVYGVEDSTYFIHSSYMAYQAELKLGLPTIGESTCCGERGSLFLYQTPFTANKDYFVYVNSLTGDRAFTAVYIDQDHTYPNATNYKWSAQGNEDLFVKLNANDLVRTKPLYINVFSYRGLARYHVTVEQSGAPIFLTSDSPNKVFAYPDQQDFFRVFSVKNSAGLTAVLESCTDNAAMPFYVSNMNSQPNPTNNSYVSVAHGPFSQLVTTNRSETSTFYYIGTSKLSTSNIYTIYATTGSDKRPKPKNNGILTEGPLISISSKRLLVPTIQDDDDTTTSYMYFVYKRVLSAKEDPAQVNMQTICAITNGEATLIGQIILPPDRPEILFYDVPVRSSERYIINVIAVNQWNGLSTAYQPLYFGIDHTNNLIDGQSLIAFTNQSIPCAQFTFASEPLGQGVTLSFIVTPFSGDVDLYIAQSYPASPNNFAMKSSNHGFDIISFSRQDSKYFDGPYYVGVCGVNNNDLTEFSILAVKSGTSIKLKDGQPQLVSTKALESSYFTYQLDGNNDFTVTVSPISGDPDAYMSTDTQPTSFNHMWGSDTSSVEVIKAKTTDSGFKPSSTYYINTLAFGSDALYSIIATRNDSISTIMHGVSLGGRVQVAESAYYKFKLTHQSSVTITVNPLNAVGDPDIFVSTDDNNLYPGLSNYNFAARSKSVDSLVIKPTDAGWRIGWYYIAVRGYGSETEFELTVMSSDEVTILEDGIPIQLTSSIGDWNYFGFFYGFSANHLIFSAKTNNGLRAELFCSQTNSHPDRNKYDFIGENTGSEILATIPASSKIGWYYCAVHTLASGTFSMTAFTNQRPRILLDSTMNTNNYVRVNYYVYFVYTLPPYSNLTDVNIVAYMNYGDADIYVSKNNSKPTINNYDWRSFSLDVENLVIPKEQIGPNVRELYIGVHGFSNALFDLIVYGMDRVLELTENSPIVGVAEMGTYKRYKFNLENQGKLKLDLSVLSAYPSDADLYVSMEPYPSKEHHTWHSKNFGDDTIEIDGAIPGTYYISVYASPVTQTKFSLTVSTLYSYVYDGGQIMDTVNTNAVRHYKILVPAEAEQVVIATTNLNGQTQMYLNTNDTFPNSQSYMLSSDTQRRGNGILVTKVGNPDVFATGVWSLAIYGVVPSSFYLSFQTMRGVLRSGVPRSGLTTPLVTSRYTLALRSTPATGMLIRTRVYNIVDDCIKVTAYQNSSYSISGKSNPKYANSVTLNFQNMAAGQNLFIEVVACTDRVVQYELVVTAKDQPIYLIQDSYSVYSVGANEFELYSPKTGQALLAQFDACDETSLRDTVSIYAAKGRMPSNQDFDNVLLPNNRYSLKWNQSSISTDSIYYFKIMGDSMPSYYSVFASTNRNDPRPPAVPYKVTRVSESFDDKVPSIYNVELQTSLPANTFYKFVGYALSDQLSGMSDQDIFTNLNFHTLCAIHSKSNLQILAEGDSTSKVPLSINVYGDKDYIVNLILRSDKDGQLQQVSTPFIIRKSRESAISPGGIILIILLILVVLYLGIGSIVKLVKYKARGIDIIPNIGFWKEVFSLFWDGVQFVFLCELFRRPRRSSSGEVYDVMDDEPIVGEENSINNPEAYRDQGEEEEIVEEINPFAQQRSSLPSNSQQGYTSII